MVSYRRGRHMACHVTLGLLPLKLILPLLGLPPGRSCHQSTVLPRLCSHAEGIKQNVVCIYCYKMKDFGGCTTGTATPYRTLPAHIAICCLFTFSLQSMQHLLSSALSWIVAAGAAIAGSLPKNIKARDPIT